MGKNSKNNHKKASHAIGILKNLTTELFQKCVSPTESSTPSPRELLFAYKEIHKMIQNIEQHKGRSAVSQMKSREDCISEFIRWAEGQNIFFDPVELKAVRGSELGVFAKRELKAAEVFIRVPKDAMMTSESVADSPIGELVADDPMLSSMPNVALALLLLYELYNEKSNWRPYINILPRSYSNILYFDISDVELLKGTSVYLEALNILRSIARQYAYISNLLTRHPLGMKLGLANRITYADYKWAVATLMTRQNPIPSADGVAPMLALIPFLDLCNHSEGVASIDYSQENERCECLAPISIGKGNEVLLHYGSRPNTELVIYNGFFYPGNSHDSVKLKLGISKSVPDLEVRKELTKKLGLEENLSLGCSPSPLNERLKAFLWISNASRQELERMMEIAPSELAVEVEKETVTGQETKRKCFVFLRDRCNLLLKLLPGEMPHSGDEVLNGSTKEDSNTAKLSIELRRNEKRLLADAVSYAENELQGCQE